MKRTIKAISLRLIIVTIGIGALSSCISDKDSPGLEFMPDMYRTPAIQPYVDYGWIKEREVKEYTVKQSALHPPIYTIPYYGDIEDLEIYLPYQRKVGRFAPTTHGLRAEDGWLIGADANGDYFNAAEDTNPVILTEDNKDAIFKEGKRLYDINCVHCHGEKGDGKGPIVENGSYMGVPDYANLSSLTDGQFFYSIYYGKGMMGAHATLLDNKEIWTIVHYINKLKDENYGSASSEDAEEGDEGEEDMEVETEEDDSAVTEVTEQ